jgi:hypothetical protein
MEPGRARGKPVFVDDPVAAAGRFASVGRLLVAAAVVHASQRALAFTVAPTVTIGSVARDP